LWSDLHYIFRLPYKSTGKIFFHFLEISASQRFSAIFRAGLTLLSNFCISVAGVAWIRARVI